MSEDERTVPEASPQWTKSGAAGEAQGQPNRRPDSGGSALNRFLGGPPGAVFLRLLFVSLIVGAFLMWLDIRPLDVFRAIEDLGRRIWSLGFDAIREIADYILAGAAIVLPVWLVLRLLNMRSAP
jgi:hypothetical protein